MPTYKENLHLGTKDPVISTDDLAEGSVTEAIIADGSVSWDKLSPYVQSLILNIGGVDGIVKEIFLFGGLVSELPEDAPLGTRVFLTTDNKFYVLNEDGWSVVEPSTEAIYIDKTTGLLYRFDGTSLVAIRPINVVDLDDIDNLIGPDYSTSTHKNFFVVTRPYQTGIVCVGILFMLSDDSNHSNTQVLLTHRLLNKDDGTLSESHNDGNLNLLWRAYGLRGNHYVTPYQWSPWQSMIPDTSVMEGAIAQLATQFDNLTTIVNSQVSSVVLFGGKVANAVLRHAEMPSDPGDVVYVEGLGRFAYRTLQPNNTYLYYDEWVGHVPYQQEDSTLPRTETIYVDTTDYTAYMYNATTGALIAISGNPSGVPGIDSSLDITSENAISNSAVAIAISGIRDTLAEIIRSGASGAVTADEVTITTYDQQGVGNNVVRLADSPKNNANSIGNFNVTNNTMPHAAANTKYTIYKNLTVGNVSNSAIALAAGSKIVPNGGIPKIPVTGGELSWVHSSDIGMVQYDSSMSTDNIIAAGQINKAILDNIVASRYNLILDGEYYIDAPLNSDPDWGPVGYAAGVQVTRELYIQGGGIYTAGFGLVVRGGGGLYCENVTFKKLNLHTSHEISNSDDPQSDRTGSPVSVAIVPDRQLIEGLEFINCNFFHESYSMSYTARMQNTLFIKCYTEDLCPADMAPNYLWTEHSLRSTEYGGYTYDDVDASTLVDGESIETTNMNSISLNTSGAYIYVFKKASNITVVATGGNQSYTKALKVGGTYIAQSDWDDYAEEKHGHRSEMYFPRNDDNGDYYFIKGKDAYFPDSDYDLENYNEILGGVKGYFKLKIECNSDELSHRANDNISYEKRTNPEVITAEHNGVKRFRMIGCNSNNSHFSYADAQITELCEIRNCNFTDIAYDCFNFGTSDKDYAGFWTYKSCPVEIYNCNFSGPNRLITKAFVKGYTAGVVAECDSVIIKNCRFENLVSDRYATYDTYLSVRSVVYENNYVKNVCSVPSKKVKDGTTTYDYEPNCEWLKGKGARNRKYTNNTGYEHTLRPSRVYRNNYYENNYDEIWQMCEDYLTVTFPSNAQELFNIHSRKITFFGLTSTAKMSEIVIENNVFNAIGGKLNQPTTSGMGMSADKILVKNNKFYFDAFIATDDNGNDCDYPLSRPLFNVRRASGDISGTSIDIVGNEFHCTGNPQHIPMLVLPKDTLDYDINITGNNFFNCNYQIANGDGWRYTRRARCNSLFIKDNIYHNPVSVPNNKSHRGAKCFSNTSNFPTSGETRYCLPTIGDALVAEASNPSSVIEYEDFQNKDIPALWPKIIEVPRYYGKVVFKSKYMCRPLYKYTTGALSGMPMIYPEQTYSRDLALYFDGSNTRAQWGIKVTYTYKGVTKSKYMEIVYNSKNSNTRTPVFRDINGLIYRTHWQDGTPLSYFTETDLSDIVGVLYTNKYSAEMYLKDVPGIDEIGLSIHVERARGGNIETNKSTENRTSGTVVRFYTEDTGTTNDPGTDIIIEAYPTNVCGLFGHASNGSNSDLTTMTPMKYFVPDGSAVTDSWIQESTVRKWNGSAGVFEMSCMTSADIGLKVHVGNVYYRWNGSQWVEDTYSYSGPVIKVVTETEYQTLLDGGTVGGEEFDPDALYLIKQDLVVEDANEQQQPVLEP